MTALGSVHPHCGIGRRSLVTRMLVLIPLLLALVLPTWPVAAHRASAGEARAASLAGTATTYYVAPGGDDANPGTLAAPLRTIGRAVALAQLGTTIVVRGGVYNEAVVIDHGAFTLEAYP